VLVSFTSDFPFFQKLDKCISTKIQKFEFLKRNAIGSVIHELYSKFNGKNRKNLKKNKNRRSKEIFVKDFFSTKIEKFEFLKRIAIGRVIHELYSKFDGKDKKKLKKNENCLCKGIHVNFVLDYYNFELKSGHIFSNRIDGSF